MIPKCMRCGAAGVTVRGSEIYQNRPALADLKFYRCPNCRGIYIGRHANGKAKGPLMVDKPTRQARVRAHRSFDLLWRLGIAPNRATAYRWLAAEFRLRKRDAHIGHFDAAMADRVREWADRMIATYRKSGLTNE